jgi:hypothetical protein
LHGHVEEHGAGFGEFESQAQLAYACAAFQGRRTDGIAVCRGSCVAVEFVFVCRVGIEVDYPRHLAEACRRLRGVIIEQRDAMQVIDIQDSPDTLFFIDPPQPGVEVSARKLFPRVVTLLESRSFIIQAQELHGAHRLSRPRRGTGS